YMRGAASGALAMAAALQAMFHDLAALKAEYGLHAASALNMVVTDGEVMVGSRYIDDAQATPLSLHHSEGSRYVCDADGCGMRRTAAHEQAVLIASEPLTRETQHWKSVPANHFVLVDRDNRISFRAIA